MRAARTTPPARSGLPAARKSSAHRGTRQGDAELDAVFHALAHPLRRQLLDLVRARPGCNVNDACAPFPVSRIAVMKHLRVLEEAGLLVSRKAGRSRELYFNVVPIQQVYERWTDEYSALWARRLLDLKRQIEREAAADSHAEPPSASAEKTEEGR